MGLQEPIQSHMGQETKHRGCVGNGDCEKERNRRVMKDVLNLAKQSLMDSVHTLNKHTVKWWTRTEKNAFLLNGKEQQSNKEI